MSDQDVATILRGLHNWVRAACFPIVKTQLVTALPDEKSRMAYQMFDGTKTKDQVRVACKIGSDTILSLVERCESMGLMELSPDKRRVRLFDLNDFGMLPKASEDEKGNDERKARQNGKGRDLLRAIEG